LIKQIGQPVANWLLVIIKELADNALDDAEKTGVAPEIEIVVTENSITVADHGSGIAPATVKTLVDYSFRMSSNAAYASPTRGQQGNALQILFAMPYVLNGKEGEVLIESRGVEHTIRFTTDPVRQTPVVSRAASPSAVKNGTRVTVCWPNSPKVKHRCRRQRIFIARRTLRLVQPAPEPEHEPASR
jgi:DNA topoisomerase VI subunit B